MITIHYPQLLAGMQKNTIERERERDDNINVAFLVKYIKNRLLLKNTVLFINDFIHDITNDF